MYRRSSEIHIRPNAADFSAAQDRFAKLTEFWNKHFQREDNRLTGSFTWFDSPDELVVKLEADVRSIVEASLVVDAELKRGTSPYRGFEAFEPRDSEIFFGRERQVKEVLSRVEANVSNGLVLLIGASGTGKSSIAKAGVLPALVSHHGTSKIRNGHWRFSVVVPGRLVSELSRHPVEALVSTISAPQGASATVFGVEAYRGLPFLEDAFVSEQALSRFLIDEPEHAEVPILASLNRWSRTLAQDSSAPETGFILVVDQLEEAFAWPAEHLDNFVRILASLAERSEGRVLVLATVRSDSYADLQKCEPLIRICQRSTRCLVDILPPSPTELAEMVRRPAAIVGLKFEVDDSGRNLDDRLLSEANDQTAVLPVLSFVLEKLYARRLDGRLLVSVYDEMGGLAGALREKADAAIDRALAGERHPSEVFSRMVRPLVSLSVNGQPMRRRAFDCEFPVGSAEKKGLVELVEERLVISFMDTVTNEPRYILAHDILLTKWTRLAAWVIENSVLLLVRERVEQDAERWNAAGRPRELLAGEGPRLSDVRALMQGELLPAVADTYATLSLRRAERLIWMRRAAVSLTAAAAVALSILSVSLYRSGARERSELAELSASRAVAQLKGGTPGIAFEYLADAIDANPEAVSLLVVRQAFGLIGAETTVPLQGPQTPDRAEVAPGGRWIVGLVNGEPTVWDVENGKKILVGASFANTRYEGEIMDTRFCGEDLAYITAFDGDDEVGLVLNPSENRTIRLPPRSEEVYCGGQTQTLSVKARQAHGDAFEVMALDQASWKWTPRVQFPSGAVPVGAFPVPGEESTWGYVVRIDTGSDSSESAPVVLILERKGESLRAIQRVSAVDPYYQFSEMIARAGDNYFLRAEGGLAILDSNLEVVSTEYCTGDNLGGIVLRTESGGVIAGCRSGELLYLKSANRSYVVELPDSAEREEEKATKRDCCDYISNRLFYSDSESRIISYSLGDKPFALAMRFASGVELGPSGLKEGLGSAGGLATREDGRVTFVDLDRMMIINHYAHVERFGGVDIPIHPQPAGGAYRLEMSLSRPVSLPRSTPCRVVSQSKSFEVSDCNIMPSALGRRIASLTEGTTRRLQVIDLVGASSTQMELGGFGDEVDLVSHGLELQNHWGVPIAMVSSRIFPIQGSDDYLVVGLSGEESSHAQFLRCSLVECKLQFELSEFGGFVLGAWSDGRVMTDEIGAISIYDKEGKKLHHETVDWNFWGNGDPSPPTSLIGPDGMVYVAYDNGLLAIVNSETGRVVGSRNLGVEVPSLGLTPQGTLYYFDGESLAEYSVPELAMLNTSRIEDPTVGAGNRIRISPIPRTRYMRLESVDDRAPNGYVLWDAERFGLAALASTSQTAPALDLGTPSASLADLLHWLANCRDRISNQECKGRNPIVASQEIRKRAPELANALLPHLKGSREARTVQGAK